jgi:peroxiredoxin
VKPAQIAQLIVVIVAALGVYSFSRTARDAETRAACTPLCALQPDYAARNRVAPDFELSSIDGQKFKLSDFRGRSVILNFWTKTCGPCLEELPSVANLGKLLKDKKDVALVTISTDESAEDAKATLKSVLGGDEVPFIVLIDPDAEVVRDKYGTRLYPETWFIDSRGVIRARVDGARQWDNALTIDFAESLTRPIACEMHFVRGRPTGAQAGVCRDLGASG